MKTPLATPAARDGTLLLTRLVTGGFLIHGVWDNVASSARMAEFERFLRAEHFPAPALSAPFSVYTQLAAAALLALGLGTRWAALFLTATFLVGWALIHLDEPLRAQWPALALVLIGLLVASHGAGRWSLDRLLGIK